MYQRATNINFLRRWCPLAKCHSRTVHRHYNRVCINYLAPCYGQMANRCPERHVAICFMPRYQLSQIFVNTNRTHLINYSLGKNPHGPCEILKSSAVLFLDKDLQDGKSINKWKTRLWQGICIGNSNCRASSRCCLTLIESPSIPTS